VVGGRGVAMDGTVPEPAAVRSAVMLACRAPSVHNSQPWQWIVDGAVLDRLELFANRDRRVPAIDASGREMILSCGAVLDHLRVALAAAGWDADVDRLPDPATSDHLATLRLRPVVVEDVDRRRAEAIRRRRTDRLPFAAPTGWKKLQTVLREVVDDEHVVLDAVSEDDRPQLAEASRLTEAIRRQDPTYQSELRWWTSPFQLDQGIPQGSRVSASEAGRVDVARDFPTGGYTDRRARIEADRSAILVLSTRDDTVGEVLRCGEALSRILLECTVRGLATCTLTHMTEMAPSREVIGRLTGHTAVPQLLIRIGRIPPEIHRPPPSPRLSLSEVLTFRG
jgi:nitroreductase